MTYWDMLGKRCQTYLDNYGYENFKRTVGVVYNDYYLNYETMKLDDDYNEKLFNIWERMYQVFPKDFLDQFQEPLSGNPLSIIYGGRPVSIDLAASISELCLLTTNIDFNTVKTIHEIGGGYGRLAYVIKQIFPHIKYRMFDIEPSLGLAKRYLNDVIVNCDVEFYPTEELTENCDILIAMDCLHEMNVEQVERYFKYAEEKAKFFYYTCWKETDVPEHGIKWLREDYPVRQSWEPISVGQHRMRTQFFEALYKCQK